MKLLFDENISRSLVATLSEVFPESSHVSLIGLERALDEEVWMHAVQNGYVLVSKDEDFHQRALLEGPPPKVVWVRLGNCSTRDIELALRESLERIEQFVEDAEASLLLVP